MSKRGTEVLEEALSLPPDERAELAERLLTSLDASHDRRVDELWAQEAEDRLDAFERGEIEAVPAREVFDTIHGVKP
ncbi:MAG: addiction module protein [Terriglobia bacterium]|jgi:putative addiction module component (TIGR02574 family)